MLTLTLLLSVTPILKDRELVLVGDAGPDAVVVDQAGDVQLQDGTAISHHDFDRLTVDLRGGDDIVLVLFQAPIDAVMFGDGNDTLLVIDAVLDDPMFIDMGAGNDYVDLDSCALGGLVLRCGPGNDEGLMTFAFMTAPSLIDMGAGDDDLAMFGCGVSGPTAIRGGSGLDTFNSDGLAGAKVVGFDDQSSQSALVTNQSP
jgi:hypothetical protein